MTGSVAEEKENAKFRILLLGFDDSDFGSSLATFCHLYAFEHFERIAKLSELDIKGPSIYSVVVNARFVGLSVEEFMKPLRAKLPGAHVVVYAYGKLPMGLIKRFYHSGADIVYANIENEKDFQIMRDAVRRRYGCKTEAVRKAMADGDSELDRCYGMLTSKLREYVYNTVQGLSVKEIADKMHVSEPTVTTMRNKACKILDIRHPSHMIREGTLYEYGLK